jgi:SPP1 gp7 family putative phage head morphogenesis protein
MMGKISFNQLPQKAIEYLEGKYPELHFDYDELMHEAHHKAFTVAKITKLDLLKDVQNSIVKARTDGQTFESWKKELIPTLKKKGWWGHVTVTNPKTKEEKEIYVGSRRLRNIFYTNTRVAYNVGRWEHQNALVDAPYLRYVSILDAHTRPKHKTMHGIIRHKDDDFWKSNYPPNGWNCRCRVQAYSMDSIESKGWEEKLKAPVENVASKDWAYDVRTGTRETLEKYAKQKVGSAPEPLKKVVQKELEQKDSVVRNVQLSNMIDELIVNNNKKYPVNIVEVGILTATVLNAVKKLLGIDVQELGVVLEKNRLLHARPERKDNYGQAFRADEMKQIVDVIEEGKDVYVDTDEKHQNVIFTFEDVEDETKINKIVVGLDKTVKKFGKTNAVITLDKADLKSFEGQVEGKIVVKVK